MRLWIPSLIGLVSMITGGFVWADVSGQISGTVRDQNGAVLAGVKVSVTPTLTGASRSTITDVNGDYVLPNLDIGEYFFEAVLPGLPPVRNRVVLRIGSRLKINPVLGREKSRSFGRRLLGVLDKLTSR